MTADERTDAPEGADPHAGLRATIERLAPIERLPCSEGEQAAAYLIADRLRELGCEVRVEAEPAYGSYAWPVGALSALAAVGGLLGEGAGARSGGRSGGRLMARRFARRLAGTAGGAVAAAALADEIS